MFSVMNTAPYLVGRPQAHRFLFFSFRFFFGGGCLFYFVFLARLHVRIFFSPRLQRLQERFVGKNVCMAT